MKKSAFFDFFNDTDATQFEQILQIGVEDQDYINWNEFLLPKDYGNAEQEYWAIRNSCALFDVSPIQKIVLQFQALMSSLLEWASPPTWVMRFGFSPTLRRHFKR